jgi:hypothetical protein
MNRRSFLAGCGSALVLTGCTGKQPSATATWPCSGLEDVKENPHILEGSEQDFRQAEAKVSWNGKQNKPLLSIWFVTKSTTPRPALFPERQNDFALGEPFTVTAEEFRRMMAGVKKYVVKSKTGVNVALDVVRAVDGRCEGCSFGVASHARKAFYQALLDGLAPDNEAGRAKVTFQRRILNADE